MSSWGTTGSQRLAARFSVRRSSTTFDGSAGFKPEGRLSDQRSIGRSSEVTNLSFGCRTTGALWGLRSSTSLAMTRKWRSRSHLAMPDRHKKVRASMQPLVVSSTSSVSVKGPALRPWMAANHRSSPSSPPVASNLHWGQVLTCPVVLLTIMSRAQRSQLQALRT